jgi:hypothetical protein
MKISEYKEIFDFVKNNGKELSDFGSAERGLSAAQAYSLFKLMREKKVCPLGIEVWRHEGNGYTIDSLGGWYADCNDIVECIDDAEKFVKFAEISMEDLLTIQF